MLLPLTRREPSAIDRMTHDIVNQLSVKLVLLRTA